ncbi:hypothetical protein DMN91_010681 [Ooceraea biroi]|uniref:Proton-coupled folate transporter n=1 Tax=Ooceraea biroi TaxID=2015173 RepID=A0A026X287_OOCBI|nr:proton-coupled folate transporter [Ooceraea biroi]EZA62407.1 Proton-coupled folate transporter [Ooceraea biroi]RLU16613.1 hypothetical protein DMN91_010681 [Ooceraea biroi]
MEQVRFTGWRRYVLIQPPAMLLLAAMAMSGAIMTDMIVYRTCTMMLGVNKTECRILHDNSSSPEAHRIDLLVQPHASLIVMSKSFVESIFPSLLALFLGPWSDKYGRKPVILSGYIGTCLTYLLLCVMANWEIAAWYFLLAYIPTALLGGIGVLMLASFCYITDITNENERAWHLAWLDASTNAGLLIGLFSAPAIFDAYGYTTVFGVATVLSAVAILYIVIFVPETIHSNSSGICQIFDFVLVKDLINTCLRKRDGFNRSIVWICIGSLTLLLIIMQGELTIGYLFVSARLGWSVEKYSIYVGINIMLGIVGTIAGIKLMRKCAGLPEAVVAIISATSSCSAALVSAFTWQSWHMYLSMVLGMFNGMSRPMIRSIMSKTVPVQDTGKIFSVATGLETLLPFAAASLYTFLYSHYMPPVYPLPVWFLSVAFYVLTIVLLICIQTQMKSSNNVAYTSITDNDDALDS